ncbi:S9 family peptidase [Marinimicrobium alkaliphilum]|uniref:S9 family peptidase n=1 Tax=Marinimicrobium alkaliphilum TaxID=2202654 RepID=UPI000DB9B455|nr:S9 family peptidase [Marinimicrobium alkaliphilum]
MTIIRVLAALLALALAACAHQPATEGDASLPPLIDRDSFFGDPELSGAQISPDGHWISFIKPLDGVMNIWVKAVDEPFEAARPLTDDRQRPVRRYFWSRDGRYILYSQDRGGDENFRIYAVDPGMAPAEGERVPSARDLTPYEGIQARIISVPWATPNTILVAINDRDPALHDVYRVSIDTGARDLVLENDQMIADWTADREGRLRLGTRQRPDGGWELLAVHNGELELVYQCSFEESCGALAFHPDGRRLYLITNRGEEVDLARLALLDLNTGQKEVLESDPEGEADLSNVILSHDGKRLLATLYVGDRLRLYPRDPDFAAHYQRLRAALPDGDIYPGTRTEDEHQWIVNLVSDREPGSAYLFDTRSGEVSLLYRARPDLPAEHLAPMESIRYTARDGLEIQAYLTLPLHVDPLNLPLVVVPHGGPWARDSWGYNSFAQFLANRGYAVLNPNFRGSTGFGKAFLNAGNREWGTGAMQHDITDGVHYLIEQGIADPERVGIMGGSYGGYATLAGLAFTPELYAAGVSIVGPSNIITLLESIPPYWGPLRQIFTVRVGDPDDPEERERLIAQSPFYAAENIVAPLLVVQGANDPRVVQHESDQIVVALRDLGRTVDYLVAEDEGHGFARRENRLAMMAEIERFLATHLDGRYQPEMAPDIADQLESLRVDPAEVTLDSQ